MAALDKYLITAADIRTYRPTAELDDERINPFILEAQRLDLRPILNDALYYDLMTKFDDSGDDMYTHYINLLNGITYTYSAQTIQFDGINPMLAYFALSRFITANPIHITRMGVVVKTTQQSEPADPSLIRGMANDLKSAAIGYQNQLIQFLENNNATYPLYNLGGASSNQGRKTSFNFFKA